MRVPSRIVVAARLPRIAALLVTFATLGTGANVLAIEAAPRNEGRWAVGGGSPPLRILGLSEIMTGWHDIRALSSDQSVEYVRWRVNGRRVKTDDPFSARLYFGKTPQPKMIEAIAYDERDEVQYAIKTTINAGGRATLLEFVSPPSGATLQGLVDVRVCGIAPPDDPIARVLLEYKVAGSATASVVEMERLEETGCIQGATYAAALEVSSEPASLTAKLFSERRPTPESDDGETPEASPMLEESILVNLPPSFAETLHVRLLEWPVHVYKHDRPVRDLEAENFALHEDLMECPIHRVLTPDEVPFRIGLVFDWSGSTVVDASAEAKAASEFMGQLFDPEKDSAFISAVSHTYVPFLPWSGEETRIQEALDEVKKGYQLSGGTALYDSIVRSLYEFQSGQTKGIPAVMLMTDGLDTNSSEFTKEDVLAYARESGVRIYPIAVRARLSAHQVTKLDEEFLRALAEESGGTMHVIDVQGMPSRLHAVAANLRAKAESLRQNPGELENDPRFLDYLIQENEERAAELEVKAAKFEKHNRTPLSRISRVFPQIKEELASSYIIVGEGRAPRSDRWHEVKVTLKDLPHPGKYKIRAPSGVFW